MLRGHKFSSKELYCFPFWSFAFWTQVFAVLYQRPTLVFLGMPFWCYLLLFFFFFVGRPLIPKIGALKWHCFFFAFNFWLIAFTFTSTETTLKGQWWERLKGNKKPSRGGLINSSKPYIISSLTRQISWLHQKMFLRWFKRDV